MKPVRDIRKLFQKAAAKTRPGMDQKVLGKILVAHETANHDDSLANRSNRRGIIMKRPIARLAMAAAIIAAVMLGLFEFVSNDGGSGVVWAEVAEKVQATSGLVLRCTASSSSMPDDADYAMKYFTPTRARTDFYKDGEIILTFYDDVEAATLTHVYHTRKHYLRRQHGGGIEGFLEQQEDWTNPRYLVGQILSSEHKELGQQEVDGVLCEGLETTDPAVMGPMPGEVERLEVEMRLWVDAATGYPVRFESKISGEAEGEALASECVMDQFQWDVELAPDFMKASIPADYVSIDDL